jgi:PKD repeat protein/photosystem II stability/assembly factor-like uncharacterized protein
MKKSFLLLSFFYVCCSNTTTAQTKTRTTLDTAHVPYYAEMMQDRSINFYSTQSAFNTYWENREVTKGSGWKPFKRWEWLAQQVIDDKGNFPQEDNIRAKVYELAGQNGLDIWNSNVSCKTQGDWKELGPVFIPHNNTGQINGMGRLNAIALHPTDTNTFYAGACAGGFWTSKDGGITWSNYKDSLPSLGVSSIVINPNNPDTMYFGSGDRDAGDAPGFGVFKSVDGGQNWVRMNSGMGNQIVGKMVIDPTDPNVIVAATLNGIYRTTNGASSWTRVQTNDQFKDIAMMPRNSNILYATRRGLFYRSTNNGVNWTQITSGLPTTGVSRGVLSVSPLDSTLVYFWLANGSVHQGFYLSRDGGQTFSSMSTTPNLHDYATNGSGTNGQAWYNKTMAVDPTNAGIIYCGGVNMFRSNDTGRTWSIAGYWVNEIHADNHDMTVCPITHRVFAANDGGLYFTRNRGVPWIPVKSGLAISQMYNMDVSQSRKNIAIVGFQDNGTANFNSGWFTSRGGDGMACAVDQQDDRYSYGELYYGEIFRVFNTSTQTTIARNGLNGINESGAWNTPFVLREGNSSTMYVGYKNIWRSTNVRTGTPSWTIISNNLGGVSNQNFHKLENGIANSNMLYASRANNTFWLSENVNASSPTWTQVSTPVSGLVRAIETDPQSENIVYISMGNAVYKSLNKGGNWTQIHGNLPANVNAIHMDTSSSKKGIYVGTSGGGLWYTDSLLNGWKYFNNGIPYTSNITDIRMYYDTTKDCNCNRVYASTYNRGLWYSEPYPDSSAKPIIKEMDDNIYLTCDSIIRLDHFTCNFPSTFEWSFGGRVTYVNNTDSSSEFPTVKFTGSSPQSFRFIASNCVGSDTAFGFIIPLDTARTVCTTQTTHHSNNSFGIGIFEVQIAGKTYTSSGTVGDGGAGYVDFSCKDPIILKSGERYPVYIKTGVSNNEQVRIYIDYDNNGVLNTSNELVITTTSARTNHYDTFTVPHQVKKGVPLRLRVRSDFNAVNSNPCATLSYGQTEDYIAYIEPDSVFPWVTTNTSSACLGQTVTFNDTSQFPGFLYSWDFGAGATPQTAKTPGPHSVTYHTIGYKKVTLTVNSETVVIDSMVNIGLRPDLQVTVNGDTLLCSGDHLRLSVTNNNSLSPQYQWRLDNNNITDSTGSTLTFNRVGTNRSGIYSVIGTANGCSDTAYSKAITVNPSPTAGFSINNSSQCSRGNEFTFTNTSSIASGSVSFLWHFGDNTTETSTSPSKTYASDNSYAVKLLATSGFGCSDSTTQTVDVRPMPTAHFSVNDSSQCLTGNNFVFTNSSAISSGSLSHAWNFGDNTTSANTNPTKSYSSANTYSTQLISRSVFGCADTFTRSMFVRPQPSVGFSINISSQCLRGHSFSFSNTSAIASGSLSYLWDFGDNTGSATTSPSKSYASDNSYAVKLLATSGFGCSDSTTQTVDVRPMPTAHFSVNDSSQCLTGNNFVFTNSSAISSGSLSHAWNFGDNTTSANTNPTKSYSSANNHSTQLISRSVFGCADTFTRSMFVRPQPSVGFSINNSSQCLRGHSFSFSNTSVIASGSLSYLWDFGDNTGSATTSPSKSYASDNSYAVKLLATSGFGCSDSTTQTVDVRPMPTAHFSVNDSSQCLTGNNFVFTNSSAISSGSLSHAWNFGDNTTSANTNPAKSYSSANTYSTQLISRSGFGCADTFTRSMFVRPQPSVGFSINNSSQCLRGHSFSFSNTSAIASGSLSYLWDFGDNTGSATTSPSKTYASDNSYAVKLLATSGFGCSDSTTQTVDVRPMPTAHFSVNDSSQCLTGNNFVFTNSSAISSGSLSHAWNFGDNTTSTDDSPGKDYVTDHSFAVQLISISGFGCADTLVKNVFVHPMPYSGFTVNDSIQCFIGNEFVFTRIYQNPNGGSIATISQDIWNFENNPIFTTQPVVNHRFSSPQTATVKLISESNFGCLDSFEQTVIIHPNPTVNLGADRFLNPDLTVNEMIDAGSGFVSYLWSNNSQNQSITVTDTGMYFVSVSNSEGCFNSDSIGIYFWNMVLSTSNPLLKGKIVSYPNPASYQFTIKAEGVQMQKIQIYGINGNVVYTQNEMNTDELSINTQHWASGVYTVRVKTNTQEEIFRQVIVK